jgi:hypothetical protein
LHIFGVDGVIVMDGHFAVKLNQELAIRTWLIWKYRAMNLITLGTSNLTELD